MTWRRRHWCIPSVSVTDSRTCVQRGVADPSSRFAYGRQYCKEPNAHSSRQSWTYWTVASPDVPLQTFDIWSDEQLAPYFFPYYKLHFSLPLNRIDLGLLSRNLKFMLNHFFSLVYACGISTKERNNIQITSEEQLARYFRWRNCQNVADCRDIGSACSDECFVVDVAIVVGRIWLGRAAGLASTSPVSTRSTPRHRRRRHALYISASDVDARLRRDGWCLPSVIGRQPGTRRPISSSLHIERDAAACRQRVCRKSQSQLFDFRFGLTVASGWPETARCRAYGIAVLATMASKTGRLWFVDVWTEQSLEWLHHHDSPVYPTFSEWHKLLQFPPSIYTPNGRLPDSFPTPESIWSNIRSHLLSRSHEFLTCMIQRNRNTRISSYKPSNSAVSVKMTYHQSNQLFKDKNDACDMHSIRLYADFNEPLNLWTTTFSFLSVTQRLLLNAYTCTVSDFTFY